MLNISELHSISIMYYLLYCSRAIQWYMLEIISGMLYIFMNLLGPLRLSNCLAALEAFQTPPT